MTRTREDSDTADDNLSGDKKCPNYMFKKLFNILAPVGITEAKKIVNTRKLFYAKSNL